MNKFLTSCLLAAGICFAQTPEDIPEAFITESSPVPVIESIPTTPPPPVPIQVPTPAPIPKPDTKAVTPTVQEEKSMFDAVRGHAYNPYAIAGAANNMYDLAKIPSNFYGQRFAYISPTDKLGFAAFDLADGSALIGLAKSDILTRLANYDPQLSSLILGYAVSTFGVALDISVNRLWTTTENDPATIRDRYTYSGDNIGLYFSLPLGSTIIYANADWLTDYTSHFRSIEGMPADGANGNEKVDYSIINANVGVLGNFGKLNYDAYLLAVRQSGTYTSTLGDDNGVAIEPNYTNLITAIVLDIGYAALQSQTARVIVGSNNFFGILFFDKVEKYLSRDNIILLNIAPNILGEVALFDNWLVFAGATNNINFLFGDGDRQETTERIEIKHSNETEAFAGIRYQKANWAAEAQVSVNPFKALAGNNILANFGGFIYF